MSDPTDSLTISDPDNVPVQFVNQVVGSGHLNGVLNITLATARFTPNNSAKVDIDLVIASRLRMDLFCATQLRDVLNGIIEQTKAPAVTN